MKFEIVDKSTGKPPDMEQLASTHSYRLAICSDLEGFAIQEDGTVIICDECGNFDYIDLERENLKVVWRME